MSSSVHFKFKSQKEPSRVTFDGTGISVFELKREIISQNRLGDGSDFELSIYNEDNGEEYNDDTAIIPRSTSVIARRLPAARPGKGGAARYVSGKMPLTARSSTRPDIPSTGRNTAGTGPTSQNSIPGLDNAQTEDEKIDALFSLQANQWKEQQQEMANATPVAFGRGRGKPLNVPDHPPPPGYLCYRCREKGHWIQACPTNNDPKFDGKYRVKRSTGIPRSLQTKVEKSAAMALDGSAEELKNSGVMVNADGDFVIANPDKAAWELYQEKAKASATAAAEAAAAEGSKELQARGLECPIDKRMFLEPTKTPCCNHTYCNDCITNALIESDFICPNCSTEGVLLDNLSVDEEAVAKIKAFEAEKAEEKRDKEKQDETKETSENDELESGDSSAAKPATAAATAAVSSPSVQSSTMQRSTSTTQNKKRAAEDEPEANNSERPDSSASFKKQKADDNRQQKQETQSQNATYENSNDMPNNLMQFPMNTQMPFTNPAFPQAQGVSMPFTDNNFMAGGMNMMNPMMMPMNNGFQNQGFNGWNQMGGGNNFSFPANGMFGDGSMMQGNDYSQFNSFNSMPMAQAGPYGPPQSGFQQGMGMNSFPNQQQNNNNYNYNHKVSSGNRDEDSPYFRQPVNPYRHQARQRRIRPSDYLKGAVWVENPKSHNAECRLEHSGIPEAPLGPEIRMTSPPHNEMTGLLVKEDIWPRYKAPRNNNSARGEAAQTIKEECERLFCDTLSAMFLGERNRRHRTSLAMGAYSQNARPENRKSASSQHQQIIEAYLELWDYANDAIYRGFVVDGKGQRTLFVFLDSQATTHGIKTALLALFELAEMEAFECNQVIACVPRSDDPLGNGIVRNLGWCGFSLTSLDSWMPPGNSGVALSDQWLFLAAQI